MSASTKCACGAELPARAQLVALLQDTLQNLLQLTRAQNCDTSTALAFIMHGVLRVVSMLEHCERCTDKRIAGAAATLAGGALNRRRRPYVAPAIEHTEPLERPDGGDHE